MSHTGGGVPDSRSDVVVDNAKLSAIEVKASRWQKPLRKWLESEFDSRRSSLRLRTLVAPMHENDRVRSPRTTSGDDWQLRRSCLAAWG